MLPLRSALFQALFYGLFIVIMVLGLPAPLFGRRAVLRLANVWARLSLWLLRAVCGTRVSFRGCANIPAGPCLVAAKHQSFLEIIALCSLFPDFTFVLKRELVRVPVFGWYLGRAGQIAVDRGAGRSALVGVNRAAKAVLVAGRKVFMFPEGTRRSPGAPADYKGGLSHIYAETGAACLPVAVDSGLFWPRRSMLRRPGTAVIEFLPPIPPGLPRAEFQRRMVDAIEAASARLAAEAVEADPKLAALFPHGAVAA